MKWFYKYSYWLALQTMALLGVPSESLAKVEQAFKDREAGVTDTSKELNNEIDAGSNDVLKIGFTLSKVFTWLIIGGICYLLFLYIKKRVR